MRQISIKLGHGELLKEAVEQAVKDHGVKAGIVLSAVGGMGKAVIRMAGSTPDHPIIREWPGPFEIAALTGTLSPDGCHLHAAIADGEGIVRGGHVMPGCMVAITSEVVLLAFDDAAFSREVNPASGFPELKITAIL